MGNHRGGPREYFKGLVSVYWHLRKVTVDVGRKFLRGTVLAFTTTITTHVVHFIYINHYNDLHNTYIIQRLPTQFHSAKNLVTLVTQTLELFSTLNVTRNGIAYEYI